MDGDLLVTTVFISVLHDLKFTDCYCTKQPQFATELFSEQLMPISMVIVTASAIEKCLERK